MSQLYFYENEFLPNEFVYPKDYINLVKNNSEMDLSPWWLLGAEPEFAMLCYNVINDKVGGEKFLIPFAKSDVDDDIACFDGDDVSGNPRIYFDIGEESMRGINWDERYSIPNFNTWLNSLHN